jgi:cytochrome c551/c552
MKDCAVDERGVSALPPQAVGTHGNLAEQNRAIGPVRGNGRTAPGTAVKVAAAASAVPELARRSGCMACHAIDHRIVGPSFADVAARYGSQAGATARLAAKVRQGGSGEWGSVAMPPHAALAQADAEALVRWILGVAL